MIEELTLSKLLQVKKKLEAISIKPYKGCIGLNRNGFFEIKTQEEFEKLNNILDRTDTNVITDKS